MALKLLVSLAPAVETKPPDIHIPKVETQHVEGALVLGQQLATEYLKLYRKFESIDGKNLVKKLEELRKAMATIANTTMPADKVALFECDEGMMEFSERGTITEVENPVTLVEHLVAKFGVVVAFSCVKIGITELRKILSEHEMKKFVKQTDGTRMLKGIVLSANKATPSKSS